MCVCVCVFLTLQGETAAGFEALCVFVSQDSGRCARQRQEEARLADQLEGRAARQEKPLVLDESPPARKLRPPGPALQLETAAARHDQEVVWSLRRLEGHHGNAW